MVGCGVVLLKDIRGSARRDVLIVGREVSLRRQMSPSVYSDFLRAKHVHPIVRKKTVACFMNSKKLHKSDLAFYFLLFTSYFFLLVFTFKFLLSSSCF
jgi:hypothetical protein